MPRPSGGDTAPIWEKSVRHLEPTRNFKAAAPTEKWLTDITEFHIPAGKVHLSPIIGCFDGLIVSWSIRTKPDAELANTMLDVAIETVTDGDKRLIVHSDRGAHYRLPGWLSRISDAKLVRSMSHKACSSDNAACEGCFGRLKTELFYPRDWKTASVEQFIKEVDAYIRWYNEKRIKISLGARNPLEYRESLGIAHKTSPSFYPPPTGAVLSGNQQSVLKQALARYIYGFYIPIRRHSLLGYKSSIGF